MKVTYIDHMGSDLSVVNAARVSFGKKSEWEYKTTSVTNYDVGSGEEIYTYVDKTKPTLSDRDTKLIQFLARGCTSGDWDNLLEDKLLWNWLDKDAPYNKQELEETLKHIRRMPTHWTPFGHTAITLHIKAPIFVARQLGKHQVGMVWNEVSRRYVTDQPEFYVPEVWRKAADNVKQGSDWSGVDDGLHVHRVSDGVIQHALDIYTEVLELGVCPEQARMVLPQSMYTEWYWTGNLYSFANVFIQRTDSHAQKEVQEVAHQIGDIIQPLFPVSWEALTNG